MSTRQASIFIGGGIALVALAFAVTAVPLRAQAVQSQPMDLHATSSDAHAPACATMGLTGTLESQRRVPLVNLWGLSDVSVALLAPTVLLGGDAPCPADVELENSQVIVFTPDCNSPAYVDSDEPYEDIVNEPHSRCDGHGISLPALVGDGGFDATTSANTGQRFELARSGIVAADTWCLGTEFVVYYTVSTGGSLVSATNAPDQVEGDLCVDLA